MAETQSNSSIHIAQVPVRWGDFDRFGHITNAAYVELAQEARMAFALEEFVFVRKIEADYLRPVLPHNPYVTVETQVVEIGNTSFTTRQEIKDGEGQICCVVEVVQVAIDIMTARPRAITAKEIKVLTRAEDE